MLILGQDFKMGNKGPITLLTITLLCCGVLSFDKIARGESENRTIKLGIVDLNEITRKSLMSKDIARQIDKKRRAFRDEIKAEEESLRFANDELQKQRVLMEPKALQKQFRELQRRQTALQRKVQKRNQLQKFLNKNNVDAKVHYPLPIHLQPSAKFLKYKKGDFPVTERIAKETLSLPVHEFIQKKHIKYILTFLSLPYSLILLSLVYAFKLNDYHSF